MKPISSALKSLSLLIIFLLLVCSTGYSQTPGPAGVGNSDGSNGQPRNVMWLDASSLSLNNNDRVSIWTDLSGNGNNATQTTNNNRPTFKSGIANSLPVVRFDATRKKRESYLIFDGTKMARSEFSVFTVSSRRGTDEENYIIGRTSDGSGNDAFHWGWRSETVFTNAQWSNDLDCNINSSTDLILVSAIRKNSVRNWARAIFINGELKSKDNNTTLLTAYTNAAIGCLGDDKYANIDVAELILYTSALNDAQRLIVDNYLGAKYARPLETNKLYSAPNGYLNNIIGVGASNGEKHIETSGNGGGLYLKENSSEPFDEVKEFVMAGSNDVTASSVTSDLPVLDKGNVLARSSRVWYIDRTGASTSVTMGFDLDEVKLALNNPSQIFVLLYRSGTTGAFSLVPGVRSNAANGEVWFSVDNENLKDGYYTIASTDLTNRIWYTLASGSWDDYEIWTLDPSGSQPQNAEHYTPTTSPTALSDEVVVLSGRNVTVGSNNKKNSKITVNGTVDFGKTTGHEFSIIEGTGRILLAGDNFPTGDATHFVTKGQGEGTVEYYGTSRELANPRTFYNVIVNMTPGNTLTLLANYAINGDFTVKQEAFQINSNAGTTALNLTVNGNVLVENGGQIVTGTANARHQLNLYGDFTNKGTVKFTNRTVADYLNEATNGIVDVNFLNSSANQSILCRGITNFYRIEIDKGIDKTYILNIDASSSENFKLLGYANESHNAAVSQLTENNNALGLLKGTVRLGNSLVVPVLSNGNYSISRNAQITVDGATLSQNASSTISVFGMLKSSSGTISVGTTGSDAIVLRDNGSLNIEGGTVNANQVRVADGSVNNGGYVQTGGVVNILGRNIPANGFSLLLPNSSSVFNMLGGTLNISNTSGSGGILIGSSRENIQVTGGNVIADIRSNNNLIINSTAPFWNLTLKNTNGSANAFVLDVANNVGSANAHFDAQPLHVLNDLRLWGQQSGGSSYPTVELKTDANDVYIGGSLFIETGAKYTSITGGTAPYDTEATQPTLRSTTHFNKTAGTSSVEYLYYGNVSNPLELGNLEVDRTSGYELCMSAPSGRADESIILDVNGSATITSGILDQGRYSIRTWGAIANYGRMGKYVAGTTPDRAQIIIGENPALTITSGKSAVFGNVNINVNPARRLTIIGDTYIECLEYTKGLVYLQNYELKLDRFWGLNAGLFENVSTGSKLNVANTGYSGESMIFTNGNPGDGGLKIKVTKASDAGENEASRLNNTSPVTYPLGFLKNNTLYFRPAQMVVKDFSDDGYVTMRLVSGYLQTTNKDGGKVLQHYWRVTNEGFEAKPTVAYRFYYRNNNNNANNNLVDLYQTNQDEEALFFGGKVLDESPYTRSYEDATDINRTNATRTIVINGASANGLFGTSANGIELENANYTAGAQNRFMGSVLIYYTRDYGQQISGESATSNGNNKEPKWNDKKTWTRSDMLNPLYSPHDSRQPQSPTIPGAGDVVQIGWVPWNDIQKDGNNANSEGNGDTRNILGMPHGVWIDNTSQSVAEVIFSQMLDRDGNPTTRVYRSNFQFRPTLCINGGSGQLNAKIVKGEGLFWNRYSDPDFTKMDIGDFARQDSSYVIYENSTNGRVIRKSADLFPNLYISNDYWGINNYNFTFERDLETVGNVELLGNMNLLLNTGATGDITVGRDLIMFTSGSSGGEAELRYGGTGKARKVVVKGDLRLENSKAKVSVVSSTTSIMHELHVEGNIYQGTNSYASEGLQLYNGNNKPNVTLYLEGDKSMEFNRVNTGGVNSSLYRLVVDKGSSPVTTAAFNTNFTLNGPTSGASVKKALELVNGTFIYNPTSTDNNVNLSTGNDYFSIPSTSALTIKRGKMTVQGNSGIELDGKLTLEGGTLEMSNGENHIEYSASGNSSITVGNGATMNVGGQIRRSSTSNEGVLNYHQNGGNVSVGLSSASVNNRGVFEILNSGSSFTIDNGTLTIAKAQTNPTISAFYFDPETCSISGNSKIVIGNASTSNSEVFGIYADKPLPNLEIAKGTAKLEVVPATITHLLDIKSGAIFDANGLDLTLKGNLTVSGSFVPNGNTTYFSGTSDQTITGINSNTLINFYNFDKVGNNKLILSGTTAPLIINNDMFVRGGELAANANNVTVYGNLLNDGSMTCTNGAADGVLLKGDQKQVLKGNGAFSKLSIQNTNGVDVPVGNHLTVNGSLKLMGGVFNIGMNYLDLGKDATIVAGTGTPFSSSNMITTNISFIDNGVRKAFKAGATNNFIFPVGSGSKYTPVTFNITANGNDNGKITVVPSNEMHASIVEDTETGTQIVDKDNALQYYWTLKSDGISGFSGTATMRYINADVKVTAPYSVADYITAQLLNDGTGSWLKYDKSDFDEANNILKFKFDNKNDETISGDYIAGAVDDSKNGAIPDKVAKYETNNTNNWNVEGIWTPTVSGGPYGAITKVNKAHTVTMTQNYYSEYSTEILGNLKVNETIGHRLGIVSGTGTLYMENGTIPAAVYDKFFAAGGGTVEFSGAKSYEMLGNVLAVNNLTISGSGIKTMPNNDLILNGSLLINGSSSLGIENSYNKKLSINGNITRTQGAFDAGTGSTAIVSVVGSTDQKIAGSFTGGNAFNNLSIDKTSGKVSISNSVEIDGNLTLNKGVVDVNAGSVFKVNYGGAISGGSLESFVTGELTTEMMNGGSFTYPVGDVTTQISYGEIGLKGVSGPSGICEWKVRYYYEKPPCDLEQFELPISSMSKSEYWHITAPAGGQAQIVITLNGSNDVANGLTDIKNIRVVGYNIANGKWEVIGSGATVTGTAAAGKVTTTSRVNLNSYSCITLGAVTPLDAGSVWFRTSSVVSSCTQGAVNLSIEFSGVAPWEFTYTTNGANPKTVTTSSNPHILSVTPPIGTTVYQLTGMKSTDNIVSRALVQGVVTSGKDKVSVTINSAVTPIISPSATSVCEGNQVTFTATAGYSNYRFRVNNVVVQNSSSNKFVTTTLPSGTPSVDVIAQSEAGCDGTSSAITITVTPKPVAAGAISGEASVCRNVTATYTIPAIANATSYIWSVSAGATVVSSNKTTATIRFNTAGSATISVFGRNSCGDGTAATKTVAVNAQATTGAAGVITGDVDICKGGTYTYKIPDVDNATSYKWAYSGSGATINGTDKEVSITFGDGATSGNLTVQGTNGCNVGASSSPISISVNTPPAVTLPDASGCEGGDISLSGNATGGSGTYTYAWSGDEVASLSRQNVANPTFAKEGGISTSAEYDLTLTVTDAKGCSGSKTATVTVYERPKVNAGIDALDICTGTGIISMTGATATGSYSGSPVWTASPLTVGTITNSSMSPANAYFTPNSIYGEAELTLTVTGSNGCADASDSRKIKWSGVPLLPSEINGNASVCKGSSGVAYSVTKDDFVNTYTWSYSGTGATITQTDNAIVVDFAEDATSGTLSVYGSSACGNSAVRELDITLNETPVMPVIETIVVCAGETPQLRVDNAEVGCTYTWSVTTGLGYSIVTSEGSKLLKTPSNDDLFPANTSTNLVDYPQVKVEVVNVNGCTNSVTNDGTNKRIAILRIPRTGSPYHLKNDISK